MVKYGGFTPREVLIAATISAADLLGLSAEIATLAPGKLADIVAVEGNPLEDESAMTRVRFVMSKGAVVRNDTGDVP
jgi:imidazolonepropionase-like amidohydrolase